jgi:hypothetical protein
MLTDINEAILHYIKCGISTMAFCHKSTYLARKMLDKIIFHQQTMQILVKSTHFSIENACATYGNPLPLQRVFHGIRFKVN